MNVRSPILAITMILASCAGSGETQPVLNDREAAITQVTGGTKGEDRDPEITPDGSWIFYATSAYSGHYDIYRKRPDSTMVSRVTFGRTNERFPKVNPIQPKTIAFCSDIRGEWDLYIIRDVDKDPSKWERISEDATQDIHPSWSPDGTKIVYSSLSGGGPNAPWHLKILDLRTGRIHMLPDIDGLLPEWSPVKGDDRIVFQRMRHRDNWFSAIWTIRFKAGRISEMTALTENDDWAAINPSWSADGRHILFATVAKSLTRQDKIDEADDLWMITADGIRRTQITSHTAADWMPTWGSDDRIYFLSRRSGTARIWSMDAPAASSPSTGEAGMVYVDRKP